MNVSGVYQTFRRQGRDFVSVISGAACLGHLKRVQIQSQIGVFRACLVTHAPNPNGDHRDGNNKTHTHKHAYHFIVILVISSLSRAHTPQTTASGGSGALGCNNPMPST